MSLARVDVPSLTSALEWVADAVEVSAMPSGELVYVNPAWCRLTGYGAEEAIGHTPRELLRAESWQPPAWYDDVDRRLREGEPFHGEIVSRRKDGTEMRNELHVTPTRGEDGAIRHFIVVRHDLSLQHEAERLRATEERLQRAMRGANDGLWEYVVAEDALHFTDRVRELVATDRGTLSGRDALPLVHPDDRELLHGRISSAFEGIDAVVDELRVRTPDGGYRWVQVRARVYRDEAGRPVHVAGAVTDIQTLKDAEAHALEAATRDPVTNLPNRRVFVDRVQHAVRRASRVEGPAFGVLFVDLRKFKQVNDRMGHSTGDALLAAVGERLLATVRPGDTVARLGGDEFGVLLEPIAEAAHVRTTARRVERALARDFVLDGRIVQIAGTVGAVVGDARCDVDALIRDADAAMYAAREVREGHGVADDLLRGRMQRRQILERDLGPAIRRRQLAVHHQPIVRIADQRPVGAEALVRWHHPELGAIPPMELLAVADNLDLGAELGTFVLQESVDWLSQARRAGLVDDSFVLHVNANARQLGDPRFADCLRLVARGSGVPAGRLFVEVTETVLVDRPDEMAALMHELVEEGLAFALDDFGTGWSSLAHLRHFPVHCLKIDRSFTHNVLADRKPAEIVRGLVSMAQALDIAVVAEGVELPEEAEAVASLGCAWAQGYLYARPEAPGAALTTLGVLNGRGGPPLRPAPGVPAS